MLSAHNTYTNEKHGEREREREMFISHTQTDT